MEIISFLNIDIATSIFRTPESPSGLSRSTSRSSGDASSQKMDETSNDGTDEGKSQGEKDNLIQSKTHNTTDAVRIKCRDLLLAALKVSGKMIVALTNCVFIINFLM